jgi:hypothetical protein
MEHQDPFWLLNIVVGIKKKKMWDDGSDDETGIFCPDLLSLVSKCAHQMDIMGLDGACKGIWGTERQMWHHKGKWGAIKANIGAKRQMGCQKGIWGAIKAKGVPCGMWGAIRHVGCH